MLDLPTFLLARIAEDELAAQAATAGPWYANGNDGDEEKYLWEVGTGTGVVGKTDTWPGVNVRGTVVNHGWTSDPAGGATKPDATHIARWHPARVMAECEAKRQLVERAVELIRQADSAKPYYPESEAASANTAEEFLSLLALPYADHPDYREEWRP